MPFRGEVNWAILLLDVIYEECYATESVACNYLSLTLIPASGTTLLI